MDARASSAFGDCLYQLEFGYEMLFVQGNAEGVEETVTPQQEGSVIRGKAEWNRQSAARFANANVQRMYGCLDGAFSALRNTMQFDHLAFLPGQTDQFAQPPWPEADVRPGIYHEHLAHERAPRRAQKYIQNRQSSLDVVRAAEGPPRLAEAHR